MAHSKFLENKLNNKLTGHFGTLLFCLIATFPNLVFAQAATIVSEREPIVVYSEKDLNPKQPGYAWTGSTLLQDIRVIDGMGNQPQTRQDVLVADGKIQAVGRTGSLNVPKDAKVINGDGLTVLPGLNEVHMHFQGGWRGANDNGPRATEIKWQLLAMLYSGITHVFDTGGLTDNAADARDMVEAGAWMGPEVKFAGVMFETASVGASGSNVLIPTANAAHIGGLLDAKKNIYGIEMVKCHSGTNSQVLRVLVAEAHKRDMRVMCDLWHNNGNPWIARQTHLDGYAHNSFMAVEPTERDAEILRDEGVFVISTSVLWDTFAGTRFKQQGLDYVTSSPLITDVQPPHYIESAVNGGLEASLANYDALSQAILADVTDPEVMREQSIQWTKTMVDAGVLVGLGTDAPYAGVWVGESLHREMEIWVNESGISPIRTIQAVTHDNARIMKIDDRTGSIQAGLEGDLLVVEGNPAENISDTRNIRYIFSNGKLVDRESLTRQWRF